MTELSVNVNSLVSSSQNAYIWFATKLFGAFMLYRTLTWCCSTFTPENQGREGWGAGSLLNHCQTPRYSNFSTWPGKISFKRQWLFAGRVKSKRSELHCAAQPRELTPCLSAKDGECHLQKPQENWLSHPPSITAPAASFSRRARWW